MSASSQLEDRVRRLESRRSWPVALPAIVGLVAFALMLVQIGLLQRQQDATRSQDREHWFWVLCQTSAPVEVRTDAFTQLVAAGHAEWRSANCRGMNLKGSVLDKASLRMIDLTACDLRKTTLFQTDLTGSRLRTADLSGADLTEAILDGADCLKATFDKADCHKAKMRSVSLEQVSAKGARFVLADMAEGLLLMADLTGADLTGADLTAATLESATLRGATLSLTNLAEATLENADLTDANWWRARGLTTEQLIRLAADFPPTDAADSSRVKDYLLWADGFGKSSKPTHEGEPPSE